MKKQSIILKTGVSILWVLFIFYQTSLGQNSYSGTWEGTFMNDFKTAILLDQNEAGTYKGKIIMFNGATRIQDDELSEISLEKHSLEFNIPAKETRFIGTINDSATEISGHFIFPDQSRHPLTIRKLVKDSSAGEATEIQHTEPDDE